MLHSALGNLTPREFEQEVLNTALTNLLNRVQVVMDPLKKDEIIDLTGEKGESLFYVPLLLSQGGVVAEIQAKLEQEIQAKLDSYLKKYNETSDDRALAIIGALSVETELDNLLAKWIKNYKKISDKSELTFSFKTDLAISLDIIPTKILNAIEPTRKIRNIFAHDLDVGTFEKARELDSKKEKPAFPMLYDKLKTFIIWNKTDDKEAFKTLILMIILGFRIYAKPIEIVQNYIWDDENLRQIFKSFEA